MRIITEFYAMSIDTKSFKRALLKALREINERAGQAWINTAVNKTPIPTWSGASRGTFQKLARELGTTVPIGPIRSPRDRTHLGRASATGSGVIVDKKGIVGFIYETSLRYLAYNEYNRATKGPPPQPFSNNVRFTPYHFQISAAKAWQKVASAAKLPNPYGYLKKRKI
jgi:hypothetical protein